MAVKRKRRSKQNWYWTRIQEIAISAYLKVPADQHILKSRIFTRFIQVPLQKMIEQIIGRYKFKINSGSQQDNEELRAQAMEHALNKMDKIDFSRGKAYSFYSKMLYYFFIHTCQASYKNKINTVDDDVFSISENIAADEELTFYRTDNYIERIDWLVDRSGSLFTAQEHDILSNIRDILNNESFGFNFNKEVLNYLRSETQSDTNQSIKKIINKIKQCPLND